MAIASTETLLSLDQYAEILGVPPAHFNQSICEAFPDDGGCRSVWYQYDWMAPGKASREGIAMAIAHAETLIAQLVGTWPAPKWIDEDVQPYPRQRLQQDGIGIAYYPSMTYGRRKTAATRWGHVIAGGRRATDLIADLVPVTYPADICGGMATVTMAYAGDALAEEIAIFPTSDPTPTRQIRPLEVTITGGVLTAQGRTAQFIEPALWEDSDVIDGDDPTVYLRTVSVYRVYTTTDGEENAPIEFGWQVHTPALAKAYGLLQDWNNRTGLVSIVPATWSDTTSTWTPGGFMPGCEPHTMQLFYKAGWPLDRRGRVTEPFALATAALATALVVEPICGCSHAEKLSGRWQEAPVEGVQVAYRQLECPWGPRQGAWEAYRVLSSFWASAGSVSL